MKPSYNQPTGSQQYPCHRTANVTVYNCLNYIWRAPNHIAAGHADILALLGLIKRPQWLNTRSTGADVGLRGVQKTLS